MKTGSPAGRQARGVFRLVTLAVLLAWPAATQAGEHRKHHAAMAFDMAARGVLRKDVTYAVPAVRLQDQDGRAVDLRALLSSPEPTVVTFIFTSCTTICPVLTRAFAHLDTAAPEAVKHVRRVSISIDPEVDRPAVLKAYAREQGAGPNWTFLTGTPAQISEVLRAFDAYTGSKMSHRPVTFVRRGGSPVLSETLWTRFDGFLKGAELADEVQKLVVGAL